MDRTSSYNIITGEITKEYPMNSTSRRFSSQTQIKRAKANGQYTMQMGKIRRLGTSSDAKNFVYNHEGPNPNKQYKTLQPVHYNTQKLSLINATKLAYNPINHTSTYEPNNKWQHTRRLAPFSKQTHLGRFNAPNYSKQFADRLNNNATDFHRKRSACTQLCHIQKSYGVQKFFRKYK